MSLCTSVVECRNRFTTNITPQDANFQLYSASVVSVVHVVERWKCSTKDLNLLVYSCYPLHRLHLLHNLKCLNFSRDIRILCSKGFTTHYYKLKRVEGGEQ